MVCCSSEMKMCWELVRSDEMRAKNHPPKVLNKHKCVHAFFWKLDKWNWSSLSLSTFPCVWNSWIKDGTAILCLLFFPSGEMFTEQNDPLVFHAMFFVRNRRLNVEQFWHWIKEKPRSWSCPDSFHRTAEIHQVLPFLNVKLSVHPALQWKRFISIQKPQRCSSNHARLANGLLIMLP